MRRIYLPLVITLALIFAFIAIPLQAAYAGADVTSGFRCRLLPADSGLEEMLVTYTSHGNVTPSGNAKIVCRFEGNVDDLHHAMKSGGFLCGTYGGVSYDSKVVITPSGNILFICQVKHNKPADDPNAGGGDKPDAPGGPSGTDISGVDTSPTAVPDDGTTGSADAPAETPTDTPTGGDPAGDDPTPTDDPTVTPTPTAPDDPDDGKGNCGNDKDKGNGANNGCGNKP